jgi:hypothetical protein
MDRYDVIIDGADDGGVAPAAAEQGDGQQPGHCSRGGA